MLKVGVDIIKDEKTGKNRLFSYKDVEYDEDHWADASKYLPEDFDLVYLKTEKKTYSGWSSGFVWDGLKIPIEAVVLFWKSQE